MQRFFLLTGLFVVLVASVPGYAWAHAFPEHAEPGAGAQLDRPPKTVAIRFDRAIEPAFSSLYVENESGRHVDRGDSQILAGRLDTLVASLPSLPAGSYHVYWIAVARDGHRTRGDYVFTVR